MTARPDQPRGRGAADNPANRFVPLQRVADADWSDAPDEERPAPRTQFHRDNSQTIIAYNDSPDIGFNASVNPYRGCEHGCSYCYARPFHEYLGFSAGLDFETKIIVKEHAPALLRRELAARSWQPQVLAMSGVTDCYQPIERQLKLTRGCLEVLAECRNPVAIVTKNWLVTRDIDLLQELARHDAALVYLSLTTLDAALARSLEPRTATPAARLEALAQLHAAGVPAGVIVAPVIPGLTDHELPAIIKAAAAAGARQAHFVPLRLPGAVAELFVDWLDRHAPLRKEKVLAGLRALKDGQLNDPRFGQRMRGTGIFYEQLRQLFHVACRQAGLGPDTLTLSTAQFRRPRGAQLELF